MFAIPRRKAPFDPPLPEPVTPAVVVGGVALLVGLVALDHVTGGLLGTLSALPGPAQRVASPEELAALASQDTAGTSAPALDARGHAPCTACGRRVAYASMSLNEDGYFCPSCATASGS